MILGAVALIAAYTWKPLRSDETLRLIGFAVGWIFTLVGVSMFILWFFREANELLWERQEAKAYTENTAALESLSKLSPEAQLELSKQPEALQFATALSVVGVDKIQVEHYYITSAGELITWEVFEAFIKASSIWQLQPVREYTDSRRREEIKALTSDLVEKGFALPAIGNKAATWGRVRYATIFNAVNKIRF